MIVLGIVFVATVVWTVWLVLAPLRHAPSLPATPRGLRPAAHEEVLAKRDAAMQALRDLEDDLAQTRITEPEYRLLRERYALEALVALKASEDVARSEAPS